MGMRSALEALRSEAGEAMVLQNNYFIEEILPNAILRKLSGEEMAEYRRPFAAPGEGRRPTLTWPREIPIEGEPADVHAIATEYADWLGTSNVPKLFLKAEPGAILANETLVNLVRGWPARPTGPVTRSSVRSSAATSSRNDVRGSGAAALTPSAANGAMIFAQLDPSAQAPWVSTTLTSFCRHPVAPDIAALRSPSQSNAPIQPAMARPISSGESSCTKWTPATVFSVSAGHTPMPAPSSWRCYLHPTSRPG